MANKRRSNNPLPNWQEGIKPESQERWKPEPQPIVPHPIEPSRRVSEADRLQQGVNREWMRMARCRSKARAKWGTSACNRRAVEAETLRLYRNSGW